MSVDPSAAHPLAVAAVAAAADVLSARFGARVELTALDEAIEVGTETVRQRAVVRAQVASTPFVLPKTLVIKQYGAGCQAVESFASEAVSYQLCNALPEDSRMCPALLAHSREQRVLVLEDLGRMPTLRDVLLAGDATAAERSLLSFARSLGRLHAGTASGDADFAALSRRLGVDLGAAPLAARAQHALAAVPGLLQEVLGVATTHQGAEVRERTRWLTGASRRRALSPADPCPEDALLTEQGVRFPDLDGARLREVALDAGSLRLPFPACDWGCSLPDETSQAMLASWRAEVAGVWPELADDRVLEADLLDAELLWVWLATHRLLSGAAPANSPVSGEARSPSVASFLAARWRPLAERAAEQGAQEIAEHAHRVAQAAADRAPEPAEPVTFPALR
jgi:hypothetical protein